MAEVRKIISFRKKLLFNVILTIISIIILLIMGYGGQRSRYIDEAIGLIVGF